MYETVSPFPDIIQIMQEQQTLLLTLTALIQAVSSIVGLVVLFITNYNKG